MSLDEHFERPSSQAELPTEVIHRRWVLSKRADDGRPLLVREDRVVHPSGFGTRPRRSTSAEADRAGGTPALT
ncbi:MAG: hypothetical protein ACXVRW_07270 [Solirubrobacteraceae bacterium]